MKMFTALTVTAIMTASGAFAAAHAAANSVTASDQDVSNGIVSAEAITAAQNG